jgi:hypothetical protein
MTQSETLLVMFNNIPVTKPLTMKNRWCITWEKDRHGMVYKFFTKEFLKQISQRLTP